MSVGASFADPNFPSFSLEKLLLEAQRPCKSRSMLDSASVGAYGQWNPCNQRNIAQLTDCFCPIDCHVALAIQVFCVLLRLNMHGLGIAAGDNNPRR